MQRGFCLTGFSRGISCRRYGRRQGAERRRNGKEDGAGERGTIKRAEEEAPGRQRIRLPGVAASGRTGYWRGAIKRAEEVAWVWVNGRGRQRGKKLRATKKDSGGRSLCEDAKLCFLCEKLCIVRFNFFGKFSHVGVFVKTKAYNVISLFLISGLDGFPAFHAFFVEQNQLRNVGKHRQ